MIKMLTDKSIRTGTNRYRAQLIADTADELTGVTTVDGVTLDFGSTALTGDGRLLLLGSDGAWDDITAGGGTDG